MMHCIYTCHPHLPYFFACCTTTGSCKIKIHLVSASDRCFAESSLSSASCLSCLFLTGILIFFYHQPSSWKHDCEGYQKHQSQWPSQLAQFRPACPCRRLWVASHWLWRPCHAWPPSQAHCHPRRPCHPCWIWWMASLIPKAMRQVNVGLRCPNILLSLSSS